MKKNILIILLLFCCTNQAWYEYYNQRNTILVYAEDNALRNKMHTMLKKFNLKYQNAQQINANDTANLYIIVGDIDQFNKSKMPKHYILYQTNILKKRTLSKENMELLESAKIVWDVSRDNINKYKNNIKHYYYLPHENYDFLDPVLLSCFLSVDALNSYKRVLVYSNTKTTDISEHVPSLFCHCLLQNPSIVIEAGVRWGDGSTLPLHAATMASNAFMIGLDVVDCSTIYSKLSNSVFLKLNDLDFPQYFKKMNLGKNTVDFVFIDTTHFYEHTLKEIKTFVSILAEHGALGFHDSNGVGNAPRGVTQALKEYFALNFNESRYQNIILERDNTVWNIIHYPYNNGMTIAKRLRVNI